METNLSTLNRTKRSELVVLILCLLIGFALRLYTLDRKSLWIDEIYTFNDSKFSLKEQIDFYKENPTYLHPPLFFILTRSFYPFSKPERDLRILPLIFGVLSVPMIYFFARQFSPGIALPCTLSFTFMTYHISLSQDGRSYSFILFLGISSLYFFMKYLMTSKKRYLIIVPPFFATLFYTSYSSIPFIALSQTLWFYTPNIKEKRSRLAPFFVLNSLTLLLCLPWILFITLNYHGQPIRVPFEPQSVLSFWSILYGILHDWLVHIPLIVISIILFVLFPIFSRDKKNAFVLITSFILPILGIYFFCKIFNVIHFFTSRYLISFLPLFFITLYLSLDSLETKFEILRKFVRPQLIFVILFMSSNMVILPFYYQSEKQDLRGLVSYLKGHLQNGDKVFIGGVPFYVGIFHYYGIYPKDRRHKIMTYEDLESGTEYAMMAISDGDKTFPIYYSRICCSQYVADGSRLWIVVGGIKAAKEIQKHSPTILKGYFDGSFLNFNKFPIDASIYLFLWDPKSPDERGIDIPL